MRVALDFHFVHLRHGVVPERTVFTDDSPVNVAAAEAEGFQGVLFRDAETLRAELVARGVLAAAGRSA